MRGFPPLLHDYVDEAGGGGGGVPILQRVAERAGATGPDKRLVAILVANPKDAFGKDEIFGLRDYWHVRSAKELLIILPGYLMAAPSGSSPAVPIFDPREFAEFLSWLESETTIKYRSEALLLLVVGWREAFHGIWRIDWSQAFEINLEKLIKDELVTSVKTVLEDVIGFAKSNYEAPDDAIVMLSEALTADVIEPSAVAGIGSLLAFWVPKETQTAAAKIVQARSYFRVQDLRPRK